MPKQMKSVNFRIFACFQMLLVFLVILAAYYFFSVTRRIEEEVYSSLHRDGVLVAARVESMIDTAVKTAQKTGYTSCLQKSIFSADPTEIISNISASRELLSADRDNNDFIVDMFYYTKQGHLYTISEYYQDLRNNMDIYGLRDNPNLKQSFVAKEKIGGNRTQFYFVYTPIYRTASGIAHHNKDMGVCAILCDFSLFLNQAEALFDEDYSYYVLYNGHIVSSSNPIEAVDEDFLSELSEEISRQKINREKYYFFSATMEDWQIVCAAPRNATGIRNGGLDKRFSVLVAIEIFVFAIVLFAMNTQITAQTNRMVGELNSMKVGSEKRKLSIPSVLELKTIALEINNMLDRLEKSAEREQEAREKLLSSEVAQKEAEMMAYRSQINPHFFFNTLECVRSMAQYYQVEMIEDIITAMSKIFRYSLYSEKNVKLAQEIDMLEQYFLIISYRFPEQYILEMDIEEQTLQLQVPSMILQPLVENAIKHAFRSVDRSRKVICVTAELIGDNLIRLAIQDNGCGMTKEEISRLLEDEGTARDSIGIRNIFERIKLFHPDNTMDYFSKKGEYTRVELELHAFKS